MKVEATELAGVTLLTPARYGDARGWFSEVWNRRRMAEAGLDVDFVQDNFSYSAQAGTIRGLHFQAPPHAQGKLVHVVRGAVFDVVVDIRRGSPNYGRWLGIELSEHNGRQLLIPPGFAHGFATREPDTIICYKCSEFYAPGHEGAIRFDDPLLAIDWGIDPARAVLSAKDEAAPGFAGFVSPFALA